MTASAPTRAILDHEDRDRARLRLDRNIVVEAGAGTGKTALLTDRALFLILGAGVPITEIVALTFTEKAAGEIQVRLGERLAQLLVFLDKAPEDQRGSLPPLWGKVRKGGDGETNAAPPPPSSPTRGDEDVQMLVRELKTRFKVSDAAMRERARRALEDMDKAMIGTLHRFAAQILRTYPLQAGVDPSFQVDEGERFEEIFPAEWARWLEEELAEDSPREREWTALLSRISLKELEALARELCGARVDLDRLNSPPPGMKEWLQETISILKAEPDRQPATRGNIGDQIREICSRLESLLGGRGGEEAKRGDLPSASWPKSWDAAHYERYKAALRIAQRASSRAETMIRESAGLLRPFAAKFRKIFAWRGLISFDGLLIVARDLVRDHPEVRAELKEKIRAFLVDEFQDTDPLQGELLLYLSEKEGRCARRWEETELKPGKLFVVGDPKQSIYRFRGADLAAYERFTRHMLDGAPPALLCELKTNFRSGAGILESINGAFSRLIRYSKHSQPEYKPVHPIPETSAFPSPVAGVELVLVQASDSGSKAGAERFRRTEAEWIAAWIEEGKYRLKDVALLFRTTTPLEDYLDVFRERQIPYVVESERYFYGTQEVQDFLNLLRSLDDPSDHRSLAGLLRSPLVALPDAVLYQLSEEDALDYRRNVSLRFPEYGRVNTFYEILRALHADVGRKPLGDLVQSILERTQVLELLPAAYHGQQTLSNLMKFGRMAAEADGGGMTFREFIRRTSRSISQSLDEGESPLADEHLDAVRIMTIHKAKGLEFPVVFLPNLSGKIQRGRRQNSIQMDWDGGAVGIHLNGEMSLAAGYLEMKEKKKEDDETARLLYVACTRAKHRLILVGAKDAEAGAFSSLLKEAGLWPEGGEGIEIQSVPIGAKLLQPEGFARTVPAARAPLSTRELERLWKRRMQRYNEWSERSVFISSSAVLAEEGWKNERGRKKSISPDKMETFRAAGSWIGRVCHKVLECWDWRSPKDLRGEIHNACRKISWERPGEDWKTIALESEAILKTFFKSEAAGRLAKAEILGREVPFIYAEKGQVARGLMDLVYRRDGTIWIADYKTDSVEPRELVHKAGRYRNQAEIYAEAVKRSLGISSVGFELIFLRLGRSIEIRDL